MNRGRLTPSQAADILHKIGNGAEAGESFHALRSDVVERIIAAADERGYRKPKNASGSRARYFYAYLQRAAREDEPVRCIFCGAVMGDDLESCAECHDEDEEQTHGEPGEEEDDDEAADISGADLIEWLASFHGPLWARIRRAYLHGGEIEPASGLPLSQKGGV